MCRSVIAVNSWPPSRRPGTGRTASRFGRGPLMVADVSPTAPPDGSYLLCSDSGTAGVDAVWRPPIKSSLCCPAFVCRQREVEAAAVLSRAANLWPYLPVKSIQVSESRAECAGGQLEGPTSGPLPPQGLSWGGTCLSLHTPSLPLGRSRSFRLPSPPRTRWLARASTINSCASDTSVPRHRRWCHP